MRIAARAHCADSQSNGSLMRCTPIAVYAHRFAQDDVIELCTAECTFTHPNPTIIDAYICYILAIVHLIRHPKVRGNPAVQITHSPLGPKGRLAHCADLGAEERR